ncbi:MAG: hypothetical protein WCE30_23685 [Mycobacterium sp.]
MELVLVFDACREHSLEELAFGRRQRSENPIFDGTYGGFGAGYQFGTVLGESDW